MRLQDKAWMRGVIIICRAMTIRMDGFTMKDSFILEFERNKEAIVLAYGLLNRVRHEQQTQVNRLILAALLVIERTLTEEERQVGMAMAEGV